jgi:signal peptidase I
MELMAAHGDGAHDGQAPMSDGPVPPPFLSDAERADALRRLNRRPRLRLGWLWEWAKVFTIAVGLFFIVRAFLVEAYKIPTGSMERTLLVGDFLLVNKLLYGPEIPFTGRRLPAIRDPRRGDVIVFEWPEDVSKNFVKRLVGMPGDTLAMRDGVLIVNQRPQREQYVTRTEPDVDPSYEDFRWQRDYLVHTATAHVASAGRGAGVAGSYFVLGDNRDNSLDSRYWGFVPDSLLRGRPLFVYYSYAPDTADALDWITDIRWRRLGERVR